MQAAGAAGCLVTGRMYRATLPFARELGFDAPLICYQGAAIIDPVTDDVLAHTALGNEIVRELIGLAETRRNAFAALSQRRILLRRRATASPISMRRLAMTQPVIVPSLREAFAYSPATKAVVIADEPVAAAYAEKLSAVCSKAEPTLRAACRSLSRCSIEAVDKGAALRFVAARLGHRHRANDRDRRLLERRAAAAQAAGFAVAMGSSPPELKAIADSVVGDVAHDGVAEAIEKYVLTCA